MVDENSENLRRFQPPDAFAGHVEAALTRFDYLYPDAHARLENGVVVYHADDAAAERRLETELRYLLYRERIFSDTLPLRRQIYTRLFGR